MSMLGRNLTLAPLLMCCLAVLAGCKLQVLVPAGGEVQSIGAPVCLAQTACVYEINDATFDQTFTAVPDGGWVFLRWNNGDDFLCAGDTNPVCVVSNVALAGNAFAEAVIATTKSYYIMPIFEQLNREITDTIAFPGLGIEVAQVDLFLELDWFSIDEVCPSFSGGACDGVLNGWDMTGWTWADDLTMNAVFNTYGVSPPLPAGFGSTRGAAGSVWAPAFFNDGWRPTWFPVTPAATVTEGWIRNSFNTTGNIAEMSDADDAVQFDFARTDDGLPKSIAIDALGAWFVRPLAGP